MHQEGAIVLEHEEPNSLRESSRQAARIENFAAGDEQTHARTVLSLSDSPLLARKKRSLTNLEITNVFTIACDAEMEHEGFRIQQAGITNRIGAELLAGNVYEVDPGKKLWPYHHHHANEEWLVVLRGRPTLRTREGESELVEGDVACFVRGGAGAHQIRNATEEPVRILMLSTRLAPEIIEYPDSDKVLTKDAKDDDIFTTRYGEPVDYWEGES